MANKFSADLGKTGCICKRNEKKIQERPAYFHNAIIFGQKYVVENRGKMLAAMIVKISVYEPNYKRYINASCVESHIMLGRNYVYPVY